MKTQRHKATQTTTTERQRKRKTARRWKEEDEKERERGRGRGRGGQEERRGTQKNCITSFASRAALQALHTEPNEKHEGRLVSYKNLVLSHQSQILYYKWFPLLGFSVWTLEGGAAATRRCGRGGGSAKRGAGTVGKMKGGAAHEG